ncbi:MAG: DUF4405 domain-containing protein [Deltaproteobacteria bacterium]
MPTSLDNDDETQPATLTGAKPQPARRKMSMALINFWLDAGLLVSISLLGWVTAMLQIVFPVPTAAAGWTLWGLTYNQWHDAQFIALCAFALLVLVHVMLHWTWVCSVIATHVLRIKTRPDEGMQTIYGVTTLIVLLTIIAGTIIAAILTVHRPPV